MRRKYEPKPGQEVNFTFFKVIGRPAVYSPKNICKMCIKITANLLIKLFKSKCQLSQSNSQLLGS